MRKKQIYILGLVLLAPYMLWAQTSAKMSRKILYEVSNVLDHYENLMTCDDEYDALSFKELFVSEDLKIYNDLLGMSSETEIPVKEYARLMNSEVKNSMIALKNVKRGGIEDDGDAYRVYLTFDKELTYSDKCGVLFSTKEYFKTDHNIEMLVTIDKTTMTGKISALSGSIQSEMPRLPEKYMVLLNTSKYDSKIKCNGKLLTFNSFDQAFIPDEPVFTYEDPDMKFKVQKEKDFCNILSLKYKKRNWRFTPYFKMSLGKVYNAENYGKSPVKYSSDDMECGLEIKYYFPRMSKTKWGFSIGGGYSISHLEMKLNGYEYDYAAANDADMHSYEYQRHYTLNNFKQKITYKDAVVPVSLAMKSYLSKAFTFQAQLGVKGYINLSADMNEFSGEQTVYGVFAPNGETVTSGRNHFGTSRIDMSNLDFKEVEPNSFSLDAFTSVGIDIKITNFLGITLGGEYQMSVMEYYKGEDTPFTMNSGTISKTDALVHYTVLDGDRTNGMFRGVKSLKRNALHLNIGLNFKF